MSLCEVAHFFHRLLTVNMASPTGQACKNSTWLGRDDQGRRVLNGAASSRRRWKTKRNEAEKTVLRTARRAEQNIQGPWQMAATGTPRSQSSPPPPPPARSERRAPCGRAATRRWLSSGPNARRAAVWRHEAVGCVSSQFAPSRVVRRPRDARGADSRSRARALPRRVVAPRPWPHHSSRVVVRRPRRAVPILCTCSRAPPNWTTSPQLDHTWTIARSIGSQRRM